jgi:hypothetical protein
MRGTLLFLIFALIFSAAAMLSGQTAVGAIGAPTDNVTMPETPMAEEAGNEVQPPVNHVLLGASSQPEDTPPSFISDFIGASEEDKYKVTAEENWYLDVDINIPGWLYIYEYFWVGEDLQGKWIAYKWQLLQSGLWRLGPFTAGTNEPEGQHIYRIWFYGDNQWAAENPDEPQNNLVYWTYSQGKPPEQPEEQIPSTPSQEAGFSHKVYEFITQPVVLIIGSLVLVIIVMLCLYIYWRYWRHARRGSNQDTESANETDTQELSEVVLSDTTSAKIALPNGMEIQLDVNGRVIGRADLARTLALDELGLISRRHFEVKTENEQFYIEDLGSANGTRLNGEEISGKGQVGLNDDDVIEPAGAVQLKFLLL